MKIAVISIFPEMFESLNYGICGRYIHSGCVTLKLFNPRDFTTDKHRTVDARPYGGGPGMVMCCEPLDRALTASRDWILSSNSERPLVVYLSPQGLRLNRNLLVDQLANQQTLILIAGRYEGIDERLLQLQVDLELSIGDFVVSGGELPAMLLVDALIRQLPSALGNEQSVGEDTFAKDNLLQYPQYTRPQVYRGLEVPPVLLSGDHLRVKQWRRQQMLCKTKNKRPDLLEG